MYIPKFVNLNYEIPKSFFLYQKHVHLFTTYLNLNVLNSLLVFKWALINMQYWINDIMFTENTAISIYKKTFLKHMKQRRLDTYSVDEDGDDFEDSILMLR